jgi:hypothetical protein
MNGTRRQFRSLAALHVRPRLRVRAPNVETLASCLRAGREGNEGEKADERETENSRR